MPGNGGNDHGCGGDCMCGFLKCFCECLCNGDKSPCACSNGEVRLDLEADSNEILLDNDGAFVRLPPNLEFVTKLAGFELDFDDGGAVASLRYTGDTPVIVKVDGTVSLERVRPSIDQHIILALNVGAALTAGSVAQDTRQKTDLLSDGEDISSHVQGTFLVEKDHLIEIWVAKEDADPGNEARFKVTGYVLTAVGIRYPQP